jgi:hypothetical protein
VLRRVSPINHDRRATRGRTEPLFIICVAADGSPVDVVAKFSGGCDQGNINLAREVIAACLAVDLGLPVPEPFLIDVSRQWVETLPDRERAKVRRSSSVAFGSRVMTQPFGVWTPGTAISDKMLPMAVGIFVFDAIIQNPHDSTSPSPPHRGF